MNILCASDRVIIPVEASPWGMFGLANMFEFLNEVKQITPELEVAGIAVTKVDTRKSYYKQTMEHCMNLRIFMYLSRLSEWDSSVEWSQDNSIRLWNIKIKQKCQEYTRLAEEVMELCRRQGEYSACSKCRCRENRKRSPLYPQKRQRNRKQYLLQKKRKKQQKVLFINEELPVYLLFKSYL